MDQNENVIRRGEPFSDKLVHFIIPIRKRKSAGTRHAPARAGNKTGQGARGSDLSGESQIAEASRKVWGIADPPHHGSHTVDAARLRTI